MIVLLDTDVLIDIALDRHPHVEYSSKILDSAQAGSIEAWLAWHSLSNFYYIVSSENQHKKAIGFIDDLLHFVKVAETRTADALYATKLEFSDFEDALQVAAAISCKARYIVTRNIKHYKKSPVPALLPQHLCGLIDKTTLK
jgi:predicted nucleic acid-binding protein